MDESLLAQIEASKNLKCLGSFTFWNFSQCLVPYPDLVQYFKDTGLNEAWLIAEPAPDTSFARACSKFDKVASPNGGVYLIRPIFKDKDRVVVGVVEENELQENLEYKQEFKLILNRLNNTIISENPEHEVSKGIEARFKALLGHVDTFDFSRQILQIVNHLQGLHVRSRGGIYFILDSATPTLTKVQEMVNFFNAGALYILPQLDIAQVRAAVTSAFMADVTENVADFNKAVEDWQSKNPHVKSLEKAGQEIDLVKQKIETYSRVLKLDCSQFEEPVTNIELNLKKLSQRKIKIQ